MNRPAPETLPYPSSLPRSFGPQAATPQGTGIGTGLGHASTASVTEPATAAGNQQKVVQQGDPLALLGGRDQPVAGGCAEAVAGNLASVAVL